MLYACLYVPDFPAAVLLRGERNLRVPPVVVYTGTAPNCFVYAATQPTRSAGIKEGMPLAEAMARFAASRMAKPSQQPSQRKKSSSSDSGRGRGIRPYRLRPTTPPQITVATGTFAGPPTEQRGTVGTGTPAGPSTEQCSNRAAAQRLNRSTDQPLSGSTAQRTLQTLPHNPEAEQQTQRELLELALTVSPRVEDTAPGVIVVELDGLRDPHGSAASFSHEAEKLGLPANVAVSQNRFVALCAAKTRFGVTHIFPGQEAGFLHSLAIDVLPLDPREKEILVHWGIRTVGELARLPEDSLVARFGTRGARLAKLARGQEDSVLWPYEPVPTFEEKMDFEWQIAELEPLVFLLSGLLDNLCSKLQGLGLAAEQIRVSLKLTGGSRFERAVALPSPLADARVLLTLLRLDLAAHPPGEAIEGVKVSARPSPRRMAQFSLLEPAAPKPEKLAVTLARLSSLVGKDRVGAPVVVDSHRPGALAVAGFAPGKQGASATFKVRKKRGASSQLAEPRLISALAGAEAASSLVRMHIPRPKAPQLSSVTKNGTRPLATVYATKAVDPTLTGGALSFGLKSGGPGQQFYSTGGRAGGGCAEVRRTRGDSTRFRRSPAFRCFRPPPEAEVILSRSLPSYVTAGPGYDAAGEIHGPVGTRAGPWKVCGEWWTPGGWQYEEWDVEIKGRLYRICCELFSRSWYVTGVYD